MVDFNTEKGRQRFLKDVKSPENKSRKEDSFRQTEIYSNRMRQYVIERLLGQLSEATVREIPVISTINLVRRMVKEMSPLYAEAPERRFTNLSEEQIEVVNLIYKDMMADSMLKKSNEFYNLQSQNLIQVIPVKGKLKMRVYKQHNYDAIPDGDEPTEAMGYVINTYDKSFKRDTHESDTATGDTGISNTAQVDMPDNINQSIADPDDYKSKLNQFVVWTNELNFKMDAKGNVSTKGGEENNILGELPFVDVANMADKDFEYYVSAGETLTDFGLSVNAEFSKLSQTVTMQSFAIGVLSGPVEMMPDEITLGPNMLVKLPQSDDAEVKETKLSFESPSPDIDGALKFIEKYVLFDLAARGLDPSAILNEMQSQSFSSGLERLLFLIQKFDASKEDMSLFEGVERDAYKLVKSWHNTLLESDLLDPKYKTAKLPEESDVIIEYKRPEMIKTDSEELEFENKKIEFGVSSRVKMIMTLEGLERDEAIEKAKEYQADEQELMDAQAPLSSDDDIKTENKEEE